jgi:hypothetical protein
MQFKHWSSHPLLSIHRFYAINLSNHDEETRLFNDGLFSQQKTGRWDIKNEIVRAGLIDKHVVLFYSLPGQRSTLYLGKIKASDITGETDHKPPRNRYELEVYEPWKEIGETAVPFSTFFNGVRMNAAPTFIEVDPRKSSAHTNSFCDVWLQGEWTRVAVAQARLYHKPLVRCIECHGPVVLMKAGRNNTSRAHAEHRPGHPGCSIGHYFDGVRRGHPTPVHAPMEGSRDPFADMVVDEGDESAYPEGAERYRLHKARERDRKIIHLAKARRYRDTGRLQCEVCETDFHLVYGELGHGFIEAHHKIPVSQLDGTKKTKLDDLALVCSNCHRMLHRQSGIDVKTLKEIILRSSQKRPPA